MTLRNGYLMKSKGVVVERPQYTIMRVALGIHGSNLERVVETYDYISLRYFTHATPTLFNAGTHRPQCSSCFLLAMQDDSIEGIYKSLAQCAHISKWAGGIGMHIHNIRSTGSTIKGTNGNSSGIVPMLRCFNATARYVDQAGKRKGAFAIYLEPWHSDVLDFVDLRKNTGDEERRCRDLFLGLWIPDLFMQRVKDLGTWSFFSPDQIRARFGKCFSAVFGDEFVTMYETAEKEGLALKEMKAQAVWNAILNGQIETGTPYMLYKDHVNKKSMQANLGTIKSSNLCTEIVEFTSPEEVAVCNLASIVLPRFVVRNEAGDLHFDYQKLIEVTKIATRNLDRVIDINYYPIPEAERSNKRHRPIGLGVQGLADVFAQLRMPFDSLEAAALNKRIFETIYYAAVEMSVELAQELGPYDTYAGSPASQGKLSMDLWGVKPVTDYDWAGLYCRVAAHGMRNSLLVAPMPTASTSQIMGSNECFEPFTTNIYSRTTKAGNFVVVNKWLINHLKELNHWNEDIKESIIAADGSVQHLDIDPSVKAIYKTAWEIKQRVLIDLAADRAPFVDQSQSLNLFVAQPTHAKLTGMHMHAWERGLKTGMYYLRTRAVAQAIKVTVAADKEKKKPPVMQEGVCTSCSA